MDQAKSATHEELCNQALEHYERISTAGWNSVVPKAIVFYKDHANDLAELKESVEKLQTWNLERKELCRADGKILFEGAWTAFNYVLEKIGIMEVEK